MYKQDKLPELHAQDVMIHCYEEMNHLGAILPELYNEFNDNN